LKKALINYNHDINFITLIPGVKFTNQFKMT